MEKLTNEESLRLKELAEAYKKTADEKWYAVFNTLNAEQRAFLEYYNNSCSKIYKELRAFLKTGKKPSDFFRKTGKWLRGKCILERHWDAFLYVIDNCTAFTYQLGIHRRTFRSESFSFYTEMISNIAVSFTAINRVDANLADILEDRLPEGQRAYSRKKGVVSRFLLAYELDTGNERVLNYVRTALESGSDTAISYGLLSGVFMSKNTEMHDLACRLLLAARLQEGLRQAICESVGCGRIEPFLMIVRTIRENNLIRYSSVKRAIGCWLGLITEESRDLERISQKSLDFIVDCLENEDNIKDCLGSEDSMKIYIALWALACRDFHTTVRKLLELIIYGTTHQAMTAGVFVKNFDLRVRQIFAVKAVLFRHDDLDVMAVFLPMMSDEDTYYRLNTQEQVVIDRSARYSQEDAEKLYDILNDMIERLPTDKLLSPCVFPWNEERLTRADIVRRLCLIASDLGDDARIDEACVKIPLIKSGDGSGRSAQIRRLLSHPKTDVQLDTLVSLACDKETYSRAAVFTILTDCELKEKHYKMLEDMLKYKAADMRQSIIDVLFRQPEPQLYECTKRLVSDPKEEKRTAGLDIIIRINESEKWDKFKEKYCALTGMIDTPTSKEKILIERISGAGSANDEPALYDQSDDFTPSVDEAYIAECKREFIKLFPTTKLFGNKPDKKRYGFHEILTALDKLIEEHKNDEYLDAESGETHLLADDSGYHRFEVKESDGITHIAFKELWDTFYREHIADPGLLFRLNIALKRDWLSSVKFADTVFGAEYGERHEYMHHRLYRVMQYLNDEYSEKPDLLPSAAALGYYIAYEAKAEELYDFVDDYNSNDHALLFLDGSLLTLDCTRDKRLVTITRDNRIRSVFEQLSSDFAEYGEHFRDVFSICYKIGQRFGYFDLRDTGNTDLIYQIREHMYTPFSTSSLILANYRGTITEGFMYKSLMEYQLSETLNELSTLIAFQKTEDTQARPRLLRFGCTAQVIRSLLKLPYCVDLLEYAFSDEDKKLLCFAEQIGEKIINTVLKTELTRGDTETRYSREIGSIKRIYGAENFVKILAALGKDTLNRSPYWYTYNGVSKKQSLSHLLEVCVPDKDDSAKKLKALVSQADITVNRLVEAALYSQEWMDIIEEYLGWKGFKSACYYFIAHTSEIPDMKTAAVIAKYSPISADDFSAGAFDVDWFKDALTTVGAERFNKIYAAAKYISDGAKHTRARKYADAARGALSRDEAEKAVLEKRNKDTLMAYALIPLNGEEDMAQRYQFIREFKKQTKNFGAQRRASESAAADCALQNLAKNAGFSTVSRLTLRMEAALFENIRQLLDWNDIDDIRVKLEIDDNGKAIIKCEKGGKVLKSIPAKYKKNELVIKFSETKKMLTEQYRRTRQMFEEAMESQTRFTVGELETLSANPVLKPIVTRLVYMSDKALGFLSGNKLVDFSGKETVLAKSSELKPAHPFDLYTAGHWHDYQKYLFDHQMIQPFKQVFRELYVKTAEETAASRSTRYAGNQIQPSKAKACLMARHWVYDIEAGLQKVYYKENVIATVYALADWFSPADIEAPTLEWVDFFDRKTGKPLCIKNVPDIIFSEVMRDVDLAVSVAHAGAVDPETSHSTIEMRRAIVEFTLPLFRLKNVRLEKSHAFIEGARADYSVHLGSGVIHMQGGPMINVLPVYSQHRGRLFLPFIDDDPKTSQIISEILLFAEDKKIKDPFILEQIK